MKPEGRVLTPRDVCSQVDDEALAKQLQDEEENGGRRKTRGGGNRKTAVSRTDAVLRQC